MWVELQGAAILRQRLGALTALFVGRRQPQPQTGIARVLAAERLIDPQRLGALAGLLVERGHRQTQARTLWILL